MTETSVLFQPIFTDSFTVTDYLICTAVALLLGVVIAFTASFRSQYTRSLMISLILLPGIVQTIIMLVNGNIGTGIAVMGAFGLVRFRSVPGSAKEIVNIFLSMAVGLATANGYLGVAVLFTILMCGVMLILVVIPLKNEVSEFLELHITIPESLNYCHAFDDLFEKYTTSAKLVSVKTTNMGSLYRLFYRIGMKKEDQQQEMINEIRCRNGNLEIGIGVAADQKEVL